jgi:hypothetical protein
MEIKHFTDCVQILWPDRWENIYPGDPIPDDLTEEVRAQVEEWLKDCATELKAQAMDDEAEREVFEAVVAENRNREERESDARAEATLIKRGKLPLPDDYREDPYLWEALARMGVVKSAEEEKAGD